MLRYEADSKARRYAGGDIPGAPVGVGIFGQNCQFDMNDWCECFPRLFVGPVFL